MHSKDFFKSLREHYSKQLPFVAYRKPDTYKIDGLLQKDDTLYKISDFTESGFVISPFDFRKDSILIPINRSKRISVETEFLPNSEGLIVNEELEESKNNHINLVEKSIDFINDDKLKKVVVSRKEILNSSKVNPINLFIGLLKNYNTAFVYCWYHPKVGLWLGATPETLLQTKGLRFSTMALAGTQEYKGDLKVSWEDKEIEEQQLVTDFIKDNLTPFVDEIVLSETKTVKAGDLLHIKTDITGVLKPNDNNLFKLINAIHPTPAVCGLPKLDAMQFIFNYENYNREFYTGFLGELNIKTKIEPRSGHRNIENRAYAFSNIVTNLFVNLRCMQIKNDDAIIYVGGGITKDSNPESEWLETVNKTKTIKKVIVF